MHPTSVWNKEEISDSGGVYFFLVTMRRMVSVTGMVMN